MQPTAIPIGVRLRRTRTATHQHMVAITTLTERLSRRLLLGTLLPRFHSGTFADASSSYRRPVLEPPMNLPYLVSHRYFSDWFHASQSDALSGADFDKALDDAWTKYQGDFLRRELKASWDDVRMRAPEWADEKYGISAEREQERKETRRLAEKDRRMRKWTSKAKNGDFDDVSFDFGASPSCTLDWTLLTWACPVQTKSSRANRASSRTRRHRRRLPPRPLRRPLPTAQRQTPRRSRSRRRRRFRPCSRPHLRSTSSCPPGQK